MKERQAMRFLGAWVGTVVAAALIAVLILGRDVPPRTYELAAIADATEERYASAVADLQAGGVLYLRSELRSGATGPGEFTSIHQFATWVGVTADGVPIARTEEYGVDGTVLRITEIEGNTQTLVADVAAGTESRTRFPVEPVEHPAELLARLRDRALLGGGSDGLAIGVATIAGGREAAVVAGPPPQTAELVFAVDDPLIHLERSYRLDDDGEPVLHSELALLEWAVLPAGTPLGERPEASR